MTTLDRTYSFDYFSDDFKSSLMLSLAIHILLFILFFALGKFVFHHDTSDLEVIKSAVRVDVVGMPKFTIQELKEMQQVEQKAVPEKSTPQVEQTKAEEIKIKPDDVVIEEKGKTKSAFSSLLKDYSEKKIKVTQDNKKGINRGDIKGVDGLIIEGNRLSKGSSLTGEYSDQVDSAFVQYVQVLPDLVRQYWKLPSFLKEQTLKCRVKLFISKSGELIKQELFESSGNSEYDQRAQEAIKKASPFPAPSIEAAAILTSKGIILGFPL